MLIVTLCAYHIIMEIKNMKFILVVPFLLFYSLLFGQSENINSKTPWQRYPSNIENSIKKLNQGQLHGGDWETNKITTKRGFSWVQFEIFWKTDEGNIVGFIAEDSLELEKICSRIETSFLNTNKAKKEGFSEIDKIQFMPWQDDFIIDISFKIHHTSSKKTSKKLKEIKLVNIIKDGWDEALYNHSERTYNGMTVSGHRLNKNEATDIVALMRQQYQYYVGIDQVVRKCNDVRLDASTAFKDKDHLSSVISYEMFLAMNCKRFNIQMARRYGSSLVQLEKYDEAINFYNSIDNQLLNCSNCHQGEFYFKSGKIKKDYLGDYKGALADLNTAIDLKETAGRFWVRGILYEKLNMLEQSQKDKTYAIRLDSIYYTSQIKKYSGYISNQLSKPSIANKTAEYYRKNVYNYKKLKMYPEAMQDSINAAKYDVIFVNYNIEVLSKKVKDYKKNKDMLSRTYIERAQCYDAIGLHDNALSDYNDALKLKPKNALYHKNISMHYLLMNDLEKAMEVINNALSLKNLKVWEELPLIKIKGELLIKLNRRDEACKLYQKILELGSDHKLLKKECNFGQ
ncbi:hypothetical protein A9Q86_11920 [Flavobacteriales bacterium 33_180_T64]|nr:hypothetical protein A9Q86_11920 [Flavobacteriales bacterium 33_180_T64]